MTATAPRIQCDYDALLGVAHAFQRHAEETRALLDSCRRGVDTLRSGAWIGVGAQNFYQEMDEIVFPGVQNLMSALSEAANATKHICNLFEAAENEAGSLFRNGDSGILATGQHGDAANAVQPIGYVPGGGNATSLMFGIMGAEMGLDVVGPMQQMLSGMGITVLDSTVNDLRNQIQGMRTGLALDLIDQIPGTSIEEWQALPVDQRDEVLVKVHQAYAQAFGFDPVPVKFDNFAGASNGKAKYDIGLEIHETHMEKGQPINTIKDRTGDPDDDSITINESLLTADKPYAVPYVVHESRHVMQNRAGWNPDSYDYLPDDLTSAWKKNFFKYITYDNGEAMYAGQPVEADAYNTQDLFLKKLYGGS